MTSVARRSRVVGLAAAWLAVAGLNLPAAAAAGGSPRAGSPVELRAEAGLAGLCKPGRWMPVRVWLANDGADVSGDLIVEWGDATLRRAVTLAAPARVGLELYVRTLDARASVRVRFASGGVDLQSIDVPVRALSPEHAVTLCVGDAAPPADQANACTATVPPDALPRSMRGYDAVSRVIWGGETRTALTTEQRAAAGRWETYHQFEETGLLSTGPGLSQALARVEGSGGTRRTVAACVGVYLAALLAAGAWGWRVRRRPLAVYGTVLLLVAGCTVAGLAAGWMGAGQPMVARHASYVRQLSHGGSLVSMRGTLHYPAFATYATRAGVADASLVFAAGRRTEAWLDDRGYPQLPGVFGLGARAEFVLEGVVDFAPLAVTRIGSEVRVENQSAAPLDACRFPDGFSNREIGSLGPGQVATATQSGPMDEPFVTCVVPVSPVDLHEAGRRVRVEGASLLAAYVPAAAALGTDGR